MPIYLSSNVACDLICQYNKARKARSKKQQSPGKDLPHVRFANAKTDDDLIEFVSNYGPVAAKSCKVLSSRGKNLPFLRLKARQDILELRNEQKIYRSALTLMAEIAKSDAQYDIERARQQIAEIARYVVDWPAQWDREKIARQREPRWLPRAESIERISAFARMSAFPSLAPDQLLSPKLDARIVLCELINVFPNFAFPNASEMHSYILFGIRPILYGILKRELVEGRQIEVCANTRCRLFFETERLGQKYCDPDCSRQQRQRDYWQSSGKDHRREREITGKANHAKL